MLVSQIMFWLIPIVKFCSVFLFTFRFSSWFYFTSDRNVTFDFDAFSAHVLLLFIQESYIFLNFADSSIKLSFKSIVAHPLSSISLSYF